MSSMLGKSVSLGIGLFMYSREKIEEIVEELVGKGEVAKKDARQFASDLIKRGEEQRNEFKSLIKDEVSAVLNQMGIAKKEDIVTKSEISDIVRQQVLQIIKEQGVSIRQDSI